MDYIETLDDLHRHYGQPGEASLKKVADALTPEYRDWIMRSRFCILSTVGPEGTDATPRGDIGPVVCELDERHLALPDWRGNNRIDSLRNIVRDPRVSLMFMITGSTTVVRVNGQARVTADPDMLSRFVQKDRNPRTVTIIRINEIYTQCARALMRAELWSDQDQSAGLPSAGDIIAAMTKGDIDGQTYDQEWPSRAKKSMW
jgi:PPOX class probable FMN-dependent enzyme